MIQNIDSINSANLTAVNETELKSFSASQQVAENLGFTDSDCGCSGPSCAC